MTAARRPFCLGVWRFVGGGVINAGSRHQQVTDRRLLFDFCEPRRSIVNAQFADRFAEPDAPFGDADTKKRAEQAFAHRANVHLVGDVAPRRDDCAVLNNQNSG